VLGVDDLLGREVDARIGCDGEDPLAGTHQHGRDDARLRRIDGPAQCRGGAGMNTATYTNFQRLIAAVANVPPAPTAIEPTAPGVDPAAAPPMIAGTGVAWGAGHACRRLARRW
jgi:hypothetical protein